MNTHENRARGESWMTLVVPLSWELLEVVSFILSKGSGMHQLGSAEKWYVPI